MDDAIKKFKQRRDARMKKRLNDDWITIKGTHVMVDDDKKITKGPEKLRALSPKNRATPVNKLPKEPPKNKAVPVSGFKTVSEFKKAMSDRDAAMSEKALAEEAWKEAKAYRASMAGKSEASLKADIEKYSKSGDSDKLDKAQHDLERYQVGVKKYGKDFGVAAAEKKMNAADKKWSDLDKRIKSFEESRGYGKKASVPAKAEAAAGGNEDRDYFVKNYKNGRLSESRGTLRSMPRNSEIEFEGNKYVKVSDDNGGMWGIKKRNGDVGHSGYSSAFMIELVDDWLKRNPKAKVEDIKFTRG